jgi:pimeloyl-ACP methyl ester carboxylesterase
MNRNILTRIFHKVFAVFAMLFLTTMSMALAAPIPYTDTSKGEPLLLIHAFATDQQLWKQQQEGLKEKFRVITLDLQGFGSSSPTDGKAITMSDYADEVMKLMDQLHIEKAIVGGTSMGGYIALAFLEKYPNKVNGLVLSNTQSIPDNAETKVKRETTAKDVLEKGTENLVKGLLPKMLSPKASKQTKEFLQDILAKQKPTAIASALRGMALRNDTSNVLANSTLPILIITGEQDALIGPQQGQNMHTLAKNSKLIVLNDAGHLSNLEQPKKWNQAVIEMFYKK